MNASTFIKVALLEQMQQIADLGLWFHLSRLIPSGVELLARITLRNENDGYFYSEKNPENLAMSDWIDLCVLEFYKKYLPQYEVYPHKKEFFSVSPTLFLTSNESEAPMHLTTDEAGQKFVHVPQWFADFKAACKMVLDEIEKGNLADIEVLKTIE